MKINKNAFNAIKLGDKKLEIRLCYGNRSKMKARDKIIFINELTDEKVAKIVSKLNKFDSVNELARSIKLIHLGKWRFKSKKALMDKLKKMYGKKLNDHKLLAIYLKNI